MNCAGLILDTGSSLHFISASVSRSVTRIGPITVVPGLVAPVVGLAVADDCLVPVFRIGDTSSTDAIVCDVDQLLVVLIGATTLATGIFELAQGDPQNPLAVLWDGKPIPSLDVRTLVLQAEAAIWMARGTGTVRNP